MVDYKYKDLYNKPHIDKQLKIVVCDYAGNKEPTELYNPKNHVGKTYVDIKTGVYYKCKELEGHRYWTRITEENEYELFILRNDDIQWEKFELAESICSESELRFGCCETSVLKFTIGNTFSSFKEKWLTVTETLDGHTEEQFQFGRYKVFSDIATADKKHRDITAYDSMYDIINSSAIKWYNTILPNKDSEITMRYFRKSFIENYGLQQKSGSLANDDMIVKKTIQVEESVEIEENKEDISIMKESSLSGLDVIKAICEINGCFGHIGRDGKFHFIYLEQDIMGLYPSNTLFPDHAPEYLVQSETGHLYPQSSKAKNMGNGRYKSCNYEDFICKRINKIQIREKENDIGAQFPEEKIENENRYIIEGNFLVYGKSKEELSEIAERIFEKISYILYRPFSAECMGNPCLEVGDPIRINSKYCGVESYILKRTLKGIQSIQDGFSAEGVEKYSEKTNSVSRSIVQLKGKTNTLIRTVDETVSEIYAYDENGERYSRIEQNENEIKFEVVKKGNVVEDLNTRLSISDDKIEIIGNKLVMDSDNFKLDEEGNVEVSGNITARENFSLTWTDDTVIPNKITPYVFVETKYNQHEGEPGIFYGSEPYLIIKSPRQTDVMVIGSVSFSQNQDKFKMKDTPHFPNGAMIQDAYISSLYQTYKDFPKVTNGTEWVSLKIRVSGVFVCVYGTYHADAHRAGFTKEIFVGKQGDVFIPTYANARTIGVSGKKTFVFQLTTDGKFWARNASEIDYTSDGEDGIGFRFDFFRF